MFLAQGGDGQEEQLGDEEEEQEGDDEQEEQAGDEEQEQGEAGRSLNCHCFACGYVFSGSKSRDDKVR